MKNRHLYKAKRLDNGEWVKGHLITSERDETKAYIGYLFDVRNGVIEDFDIVEVIPSTLCQCTGLTDKNDKPIWENDIVVFEDRHSTESGYAEMDCTGEVLWDDETLSFQVTERLSAESYDVLADCIVFGNIFDNPELLEVGE